MAGIKIKGSTLIEVIVAMTILAISVTATFIIVSNYQHSGSTRLKNVARSHIERMVNESIQEKNYLDETIELGYLKLEKKTETYQKQKNLLQISVEAFDRQERRVAYKKILIKIENEEK